MQSPEPPTSAVAQKNEPRAEQLNTSGRNGGDGAGEGRGRRCGNKRGGKREIEEEEEKTYKMNKE